MAGEACGVDQDFEGAFGGDGLGGRVQVGNVEGQGGGAEARRLHFSRDGGQRVDIAGDQRHLRPLFCQRDRSPEPDAGRRTGDQRTAAIQAERRRAGQGHSAAVPYATFRPPYRRTRMLHCSAWPTKPSSMQRRDPYSPITAAAASVVMR